MANAKDLQKLRDRDIRPTEEVLRHELGEANDSYIKFLTKLSEHEIILNWNYYTDGKAWLGKGIYKWTGSRGGQKEKTIFWLSIWEGYFKVTVYLPVKCREEILQLPFSLEVSQKIKQSKQMGNKLKFFPVVFDLCTDNLFKEIFSLIDFKKNIK